jgi:hypothetical protein
MIGNLSILLKKMIMATIGALRLDSFLSISAKYLTGQADGHRYINFKISLRQIKIRSSSISWHGFSHKFSNIWVNAMRHGPTRRVAGTQNRAKDGRWVKGCDLA